MTDKSQGGEPLAKTQSGGLQKSESSLLTKMKAGLTNTMAAVKQKFEQPAENGVEISAPQGVAHVGHVSATDVESKSLKELGVSPDFLPFVCSVNAALRERGAPPLSPQEATLLYRSSMQLTTGGPALPPRTGAGSGPPLPAKPAAATPSINESAMQLRVQVAEKELDQQLGKVSTLSAEIEQLKKILTQKQAKLKETQKTADTLGDELISLYEQLGQTNSASNRMSKDPQAVLKHMSVALAMPINAANSKSPMDALATAIITHRKDSQPK